MPTFGQEQAQLIADQVSAAQAVQLKMGTVASRETGTARAYVSFDGSSGVAQPVKCFESVVVDIGDRVGLVKVEADWIIVGNYTPRAFGETLNTTQYSSAAPTYAGSSFADMPSSPKAALVKYRDSTQIQVFFATSLRTDAANTTVEYAANILYPDGTSVDVQAFKRVINAASDHRDHSGGVTTALTLPGGGTYAVGARWRRAAGTGNLIIDQNDSVTVWAKEVIA